MPYHEVLLEAPGEQLENSPSNDLRRVVQRFQDTTDFEDRRKERELSELQEWCLKRDVEVPDTMAYLSDELRAMLPLAERMEEITEAMLKHDVVLLMAPTGSGKSLLAPLLFKRFKDEMKEHSRYSNDLFDSSNKALMMVPNGEHVGGCTRMCSKIYMRNGLMCQVAGFYSAYEEVPRDKKINGFLESGPLEFNIVSYEFGEKLLTDAFLNLLILDEAHESNPSIVMSIDAARRMLTGNGKRRKRRLERLLMMTATMTEEDVDDLRRTFESEGLTFASITFDEREIPRSKDLKMSCLYSPGEDLPSGFSRTDLSRALDNCDQSYTKEIFRGAPNMKLIEERLEVALNYVMRKSGEVVRSQKSQHVPSIVVILPGLEHVEKFFSRVRGMDHFRVTVQVRNGDGTKKMYNDDAFVPIRITSTVKDDDKVTSPCTIMGSWGGRRGRIVLTTNMIASGLTVPGAAWIIDCGVVKIISEYQANGLFSLDMEFIDREMMIQRAGRTGRTNDGEYSIGLSLSRVNEISHSSVRRKQLMRQFDENHWMRMKIQNLDLTWKPDDRIVQRFEKSFENRGYLVNDEFTPSTLLLAEQFPFLPTDYAWILVQGIRLGIAAHVVIFISDLLCSVKFIPPGTKGRESQGGPSDSCTATDRFAKVMYESGEYGEDTGDSIAHTDYIVTFFHSLFYAEFELTRAADAHMIDDEKLPWGSFWTGEWTHNVLAEPKEFKDIYSLFVRDEGRDALVRYRRQIEGACRAVGLMRGGTLFDPRFNRYWMSEENACLNENGRALFMALLTMHSSRVGMKVPAGSVERPRRMRDDEMYYVYDETNSWKKFSIVVPERVQWEAHDGLPFGRYTEGFRRGNINNDHSACLDAISVPHMAYFLNINAKIRYEITKSSHHVPKYLLKLDLNGSPEKNGIQFSTYQQTAVHVVEWRSVLKKGSERLLVDSNRDLVDTMERALIDMWREGGSTDLTGYRQCNYDSDDY